MEIIIFLLKILFVIHIFDAGESLHLITIGLLAFI